MAHTLGKVTGRTVFHFDLVRTSVLAAVVTTVTLMFGATVPAPVELLTKVYTTDGTTFPTPSQGFVYAAIAYFVAPTVPSTDGYQGQALTTPEHIVAIDQSIADGGTALQTATAGEQGRYLVFGYSQSTVVTMNEKAELQQQAAQGQPIPDVTFVGIGVGNRPNGGIAARCRGW
jgi:PE-PPE domain-containing protein